MLNFEGASLGDFTFSTSWFCEDIFTVIAGNDWLSMTENNIGLAAASAFNIHKVGVWGGNKSFKLMGLSFLFVGWVQ